MADLLIPKAGNIVSPDGWEIVEKTLPNGFRHLGSAEFPDKTVYDIGQNAAREFRKFRRSTDPWTLNSHVPQGEPLSPEDLAGLGLLPNSPQPREPISHAEEGVYGGLCTTHLI